MEINLTKNRQFKTLMATGYLNNSTVGSILREVLGETIGPASIAKDHWERGQGQWKPLSARTLLSKGGDRRIFYQSGRVYRAITQPATGGKLTTWGSSADIYSSWITQQPKQFSANGIYARGKVNKTSAMLTVGFAGKYKHSRGFNALRRTAARQALKRGPKGRITAKEVRNTISVGQTVRRMRQVNADRSARGLKTIRKTAAMGSTGFTNGKFDLARGNNNLAYADIVQRGEFKGLRLSTGMLMNPRGLAIARKRIQNSVMAANPKGTRSQIKKAGRVYGALQFGGSSAVYGVARPLLPFKDGDIPRLMDAVEYGLNKILKKANG